MEFSYYDKHINKNTTQKYDLTPIFKEVEVFSSLLDDMLTPFKDTKFDFIVGLGAIGFIIGGALAQRAKKGFVPIRKGGKLPGIEGTKTGLDFVDYSKTQKRFEINNFAIAKGDRVLLADDWIETGSQMKAAIKLIEEKGGIVVGITSIAAEKNENTKILFEKYNCKPVGVL